MRPAYLPVDRLLVDDPGIGPRAGQTAMLIRHGADEQARRTRCATRDHWRAVAADFFGGQSISGV